MPGIYVKTYSVNILCKWYITCSINCSLLRLKLDRRRLEGAHFKYAVLNVVLWYVTEIGTEIIFTPNLNETLLQFFPKYQNAFHKQYSGH